ncbi:matrixin family metalloprotease [Flavisolibacter nicotianae]|uniref:matrixin family metalloprotease n=1 Tax=Flavisolibacter nicotianae TaxID=2364882 RepID=UPI000EAB9620|nr:matrixin family metalloprotease [Flavisolibacter nicotianae]
MQSSTLQKRAGIILTGAFCLLHFVVFSQDLSPLTLKEKIKGSRSIVLARFVDYQSYLAIGDNIYTLHKVTVIAHLRKKKPPNEFYIIAPGGWMENRATVVYPSIHLADGAEAVLFIEDEDFVFDNKAVRAQQPKMPQYKLYGYPQGAMLNVNNWYDDVGGRKPETQLLSDIASLAGDQWVTAKGDVFAARKPAPQPPPSPSPGGISSFAPNPTRSGTINPSDYLTITGSGFGSAPGTVAFANADDGGASRITPPATSDYVSWADNQIVVKVPTRAGTGSFVVNSTFTSPSALTVSYALIDIYSSFLNFPVTTRQLPHLVNKNGLGGYTFLYNSTSGFSGNAAAVAAYERALTTWRGATGVNFRTGGTTTATNTNDGINTVLFGTLPAGTLAQTLTNYSGTGSTGSCERQNTVWYINDIDMVFSTVPTSNTTWQFGPSLPGFYQYDFESVALHELGHAHNLGHVIAPGQVMHYAISNGQTARTLSANDIAAGKEMMAWSSSLCLIPAGVFGPMTPTTATLTQAVTLGKREQNAAATTTVKAWIDKSLLRVNFSTESAAQHMLYLYNAEGRLLLQQKLPTQQNLISLPPAARGALLYRIRTNENWQTGKLFAQ